MKIILTGAAGFIGFHLCRKLMQYNYDIIGIDNLNSYYSIKLKKDRLKILNEKAKNKSINWKFIRGDIIDKKVINETFDKFKPEIVIHLAAQAGVRYSLDNPEEYINSNLLGFFNIIDSCKNFNVKNFIYASSSSVYGGNTKMPFSEIDSVDHPVSLYAATKKANELIAHSYSHLYDLPSTGLRFFTVYGPWGRPDMAPMIFTKSIISGDPIKIFNKGDMYRDFTYIDDVVDTIFKIIKLPATKNNDFNNKKPLPNTSWAPHRIYNVGNGNPVSLLKFIEIIEEKLKIKSKKILKPMQPGDIKATYSNISSIEQLIGKTHKTTLEKGLKLFLDWYKNYYF